MNTVLPLEEPTTVSVWGRRDRFPVRRVYCVGRNYRAHAVEMGADPDREPPFFFMKPTDAVFDGQGATVAYPPDTEELHHEVELVVALGRSLSFAGPEEAVEAVFGYTVGIDLTRRDRQLEARERGRPWEWGKAFDRSGPIAPIVPAVDIHEPLVGRIGLSVNGETRQQARLSELVWGVGELLGIASHSMELRAGDVFFTGTPAGVGALLPGDRVVASIDGVAELDLTIGERGR